MDTRTPTLTLQHTIQEKITSLNHQRTYLTSYAGIQLVIERKENNSNRPRCLSTKEKTSLASYQFARQNTPKSPHIPASAID
jgi:hypothetical protein